MIPVYVERILFIVISIFNNKITTAHSISRKHSHHLPSAMSFAYLCATTRYDRNKVVGGKKAANFSCVISPHRPSWLSLIASIIYFNLLCELIWNTGMEESSNLLVTQPAACSKITQLHLRERSGLAGGERERGRCGSGESEWTAVCQGNTLSPPCGLKMFLLSEGIKVNLMQFFISG